MSVRLLSPHAQKAVYLLRSHYAFVRMLRRNARSSWRVPEFSMAYRMVNTNTGAEVLGLGEKTFKELKRARLLDEPAKFPSRYPELLRRRKPWSGDAYTEHVYTLDRSGLTAVVLTMIVKACDLKEEFYNAD